MLRVLLRVISSHVLNGSKDNGVLQGQGLSPEGLDSDPHEPIPGSILRLGQVQGAVYKDHPSQRMPVLFLFFNTNTHLIHNTRNTTG